MNIRPHTEQGSTENALLTPFEAGAPVDGARVRLARAENPKLRERDLAQRLGISEAEFLAAGGSGPVTRLDIRFEDIFNGLKTVGEVMSLVRNESAVHEKIGPFEKFLPGRQAALVLGEQIDQRIFPSHFVYGFAVEKADGTSVRHSLQFFDKYGDAVMKIHARAATDMEAWAKLVASLKSADQPEGLSERLASAPAHVRPTADLTKERELRERWKAINDPHQFFGMLRELEMDRLNALHLAGEELAWELEGGTVAAMLKLAAQEQIPIMCFIGSRGCIQIHHGAVHEIKEMGPWINIMDPTFHMHLRQDHITEVWAVRKGADHGHVTSIEAYDAAGQLIVQFFGVRTEGQAERDDWRELVENLPRIRSVEVA
ncbi:hemin-degrading factor [Roseibium suaedae]|uniref:Putative hemin transport protein n=1 Tax=Roseibium suaedae TaxID=735517 RepID=A0A1M7F866_9HYPH|nr:ChuX/HutX family heme-like substrate-binding protein [Roseibium suaedae]SHM00272.1 putative hemin transport protein [Roseibium suaedae]